MIGNVGSCCLVISLQNGIGGLPSVRYEMTVGERIFGGLFFGPEQLWQYVSRNCGDYLTADQRDDVWNTFCQLFPQTMEKIEQERGRQLPGTSVEESDLPEEIRQLLQQLTGNNPGLGVRVMKLGGPPNE